MKDLITIACLTLAVSFAPAYSSAGENVANNNDQSMYGVASSGDSGAVDEDSEMDTDRSQPGAFVKDSSITAKVKAKLASEHAASLANIHVDTDANGIVWLSGTVKTQMEADEAVATAKATEGVVSVKNNLRVAQSS